MFSAATLRVVKRVGLLVLVVFVSLSWTMATTTGAQVAFPNFLRIVKVIDGTAPPGTTFTVSITCSASALPTPITADVTFDAGGNPLSPSPGVDAPSAANCTASETAQGGATSIAYSCSIEESPVIPAVSPAATTGSCSGDNAVSFSDTFTDTATITVTNTFAPPPAPPPPPVEIAPVFTG
jgi:hypothetical protein